MGIYMEVSVRRWFDFHGANRTASVHEHHPLPKVEFTRDRDRGADVSLHTALELKVGHHV